MSLADDILGITEKVTKEWTKQRKAEERGRRSRFTREYVYSDRVNFTDAAHKILPGAYAHASGDGTYSVSKRQFFYSCREAFKDATGRELEYPYFANTLLVQYLNRHPETAAWKVTADPRGTLTIPNTGHDTRIPVGTLQIEKHLRKAAAGRGAFDDVIDAPLPVEWPSVAAGQRYQAVLYIEKEGFEPLLEEARIAEKFDLAVVSCKGQSVVAARMYVDQVCRVAGGVPLFVVHDFDKYGFEISQCLTTVSDWAVENDRVTYQFRNEINVTDLGLRLADVEQYELPEEDCDFKGDFGPGSIATEEEQEFLRSGRRVELNAFTSPQFIEWLEAKLGEHLPGRLIPKDAVLQDAYRRALAVAEINRAIEEVRDNALEMAENADIPKSLRRRLEKAMKGAPHAWDVALYGLAKRDLGKVKEQWIADALDDEDQRHE
jgi:hypothetical protein